MYILSILAVNFTVTNCQSRLTLSVNPVANYVRRDPVGAPRQDRREARAFALQFLDVLCYSFVLKRLAHLAQCERSLWPQLKFVTCTPYRCTKRKPDAQYFCTQYPVGFRRARKGRCTICGYSCDQTAAACSCAYLRAF